MPPAIVHLDGAVVGIDIGGTKTHAVAFDHRFNAIADVLVPTGADGADAVAASAIDTLSELKRRIDGTNIESIGVGIPGLVDRESGSVRQAVNLGLGNKALDIADRLTAAFGVPCMVDNDVNAAALGAFEVLGRDNKISDLAYLSIGTGIAAGLVLNGRLHRGQRGVAGEIGHFPITDGGPRCRCGLHGCLETVASGSAITRLWPTNNGTRSADALFDAVRNDDQDAEAVLAGVADHLARAIYLLAVTYDVDHIVIGGGVAEAGNDLLNAINGGISRLEEQSSFVRSLDLGRRVELKPEGPIGVIGAAVLAASFEPAGAV
jgi:glucokinase